MNEQEAMNLKEDDVVVWDDKPRDKGTVTEVNFGGFFVVWDDPEYGMGWIDFKDAGKVSLVDREE